MSAFEDRLAAIIAEHRLSLLNKDRDCRCGWRAEGVKSVIVAHAAHVAAAIASADDLAVVELPKLEPSGSFGDQVWSAIFTEDDRRWSDDYDPCASVTVNDGMVDVEVDVDGGLFADESRRVAAGILAAAKAAEGVSDR